MNSRDHTNYTIPLCPRRIGLDSPFCWRGKQFINVGERMETETCPRGDLCRHSLADVHLVCTTAGWVGTVLGTEIHW